MASLSFYPQFETNLMSNRKVTELLLQLKSAKDHGKNYTKVKPHLVLHFLRNRLLKSFKTIMYYLLVKAYSLLVVISILGASCSQ